METKKSVTVKKTVAKKKTTRKLETAEVAEAIITETKTPEPKSEKKPSHVDWLATDKYACIDIKK